jgi:tetratricopeptide (TPR) repeat protein
MSARRATEALFSRWIGCAVASEDGAHEVAGTARPGLGREEWRCLEGSAVAGLRGHCLGGLCVPHYAVTRSRREAEFPLACEKTERVLLIHSLPAGPGEMRVTPSNDDATDDARRWSAVEEATELLHEERFREALIELRGVLEDDPKNAYAYHFLGVAFFEVGELEAARDAYIACLRLSPRYLGARVALAHVLRALGDSRGAIREGMAALSQVPGDPDALHAIALAHHARGDEAAARKYLEAFLETRPEFEVAVEARALLASLGGGPALSPAADDD